MPVSPANQGNLVFRNKTVLDCGIICVEEVTVYSDTNGNIS